MSNERSIKEKSTKVGNYYVLDCGDYFKVYDENENDVTLNFNDDIVIMNNNEFQKAITRILIKSRKENRKNLNFIANVIVKNMYDCVTEIKPLTYTELRDEDGERYFSFEIMLNDYDFDTNTLEIKLDEFFEVHDEIVTIYMDRLQFKDYEVINENGLKELNVIFRVLN